MRRFLGLVTLSAAATGVALMRGVGIAFAQGHAGCC